MLLIVLTAALSLKDEAEDACRVGYAVVKQKVHHTAAALKAWAAYNKKLVAEGKPLPKGPKMSRADALLLFNKACAPLEPIPSELTAMVVPDDDALLPDDEAIYYGRYGDYET